MYFADPSWKLVNSFREHHNRGVSLANSLNSHYNIITDRLIDEGRLSWYKLLIASGTDYISESNFRRIVKFVCESGHVVLMGDDVMRKDVYGRRRDLDRFVDNRRVIRLGGSAAAMRVELEHVYD